MEYNEFELIDFANYVLQMRRYKIAGDSDVTHAEFMNWLESRKPQEFIRRIREMKLDLLFDYEDKEIKINDEHTK